MTLAQLLAGSAAMPSKRLIMRECSVTVSTVDLQIKAVLQSFILQFSVGNFGHNVVLNVKPVATAK